MRKFKKYINTFYRPAFLTLSIGLGIFALSLCILATDLHSEILAGESDIIYRYPKMLEEILFPFYILLFVTFIVDLNERKKEKLI